MSSAFRKASGSPFYSQGLERYLYAELLERQGRTLEALTWYDSFSGNSVFDLIYLAPSHLQRARIAERLGRPEEAIGHYASVVALWKDCDPELRPIPDEARARLAALRGAARGGSQ